MKLIGLLGNKVHYGSIQKWEREISKQGEKRQIIFCWGVSLDEYEKCGKHDQRIGKNKTREYRVGMWGLLTSPSKGIPLTYTAWKIIGWETTGDKREEDRRRLKMVMKIDAGEEMENTEIDTRICVVGKYGSSFRIRREEDQWDGLQQELALKLQHETDIRLHNVRGTFRSLRYQAYMT